MVVLLDAFQTIILPRRAAGRLRLTRIFYILTWMPWRFVALRIRHPRKRETALSFYGPLSLIFLLVVWASGMVFGFSLIYYALGSPFSDTSQTIGYLSDLYVSGTNFFTLGLGDVTPRSEIARVLSIFEAGTGFGFLAIVMGYFPVLYAAFSRREVSISLLDARAGSPPTAAELMRRHSFEGAEDVLAALLSEWERWSAELLESHISYTLALLFPLATHQSELDQRAHRDARHFGTAHRRSSRTRSSPGAVDLCHGSSRHGRSGAGLLHPSQAEHA